MEELPQLGSGARPATGGGEEKRAAAEEGGAFEPDAFSLGRKAGAGEEKSSSHSNPPPAETKRPSALRETAASGRRRPVGVFTFFVCGAFGVGEAVQAAGRGRGAAELWSWTTGAVGVVAQLLGGGLLNQRAEILIIAAPKACWEL